MMTASPYQAGLVIFQSVGYVCLCMRAFVGAGEDSWVRRTQLAQKHSEQPM